ncbi:hypothetical protein TruAng_011739 [Truncatella angustata]|nr:hypothetical protein TruAng_011739 [Truncatella angustata]
MDPPQLTCSPPCNIRLLPWTGATRVINYPILTVSSDTWTTTITALPLTITDLIFADKTITRGSGNNKRADLSYWPEPTTTTFWPAVSYTGPNGQVSYTSPTGTFPALPASIGPDAAEPTSGSYPVSMCDFLFFDMDSTCIQQPWLYGRDDGGDPAPSDEEKASEYKTTCPIVTTSSTSTTAAAASTAIVVPVLAPSPYVDGDPGTNSVSCYNSGETTENVRMQHAATTFCNLIKDDDFGPGYKFSFDSAFSYNGGVGSVTITNSLQIKDGCTFDYDFNLCRILTG